MSTFERSALFAQKQEEILSKGGRMKNERKKRKVEEKKVRKETAIRIGKT